MKNKNDNINLLTDFGFKRFFGTEQYKNNLIHFLNAFLPPYIGPVDDINYLTTEQLGQSDQNKRLIFDVLCASPKNDHIIIEMQKASQEFIKNRMIACSARHISNSLDVGDRKYNFPTILTIVLVDFEVPELRDSDRFVQYVMLKDDNNDIFSEKMSFLLIDLTKFAVQKSFAQLTDERQKWCYVIKNICWMNDDDIPRNETVFRELYKNCKVSKLTAMEKQEYEKSVLEYEDVKDAMEYHHRLGKEEGREEGRAEGRVEGIEEGKRLMVLNMLSKSMPIATIAEIAEMTEEEVRLCQEGQ